MCIPNAFPIADDRALRHQTAFSSMQTLRWKADGVSLVHSWACRRLHVSFKVPASSRPVTRLYILAFEWGVGAEKRREVSQWKHVIFTFSSPLSLQTLIGNTWRVTGTLAWCQNATWYRIQFYLHQFSGANDYNRSQFLHQSSRIWIQSISTAWTEI